MVVICTTVYLENNIQVFFSPFLKSRPKNQPTNQNFLSLSHFLKNNTKKRKQPEGRTKPDWTNSMLCNNIISIMFLK